MSSKRGPYKRHQYDPSQEAPSRSKRRAKQKLREERVKQIEESLVLSTAGPSNDPDLDAYDGDSELDSEYSFVSGTSSIEDSAPTFTDSAHSPTVPSSSDWDDFWSYRSHETGNEQFDCEDESFRKRGQSDNEDSSSDFCFTDSSSEQAVEDSDLSFEKGFLTSGPKLYNGSPLSKGMSYFLTMAYIIKHKLTSSAAEDLVSLVKMLCPEPNHCAESLYLLKKHFTDNFRDAEHKVYYCCSICQKDLPNADSTCDREACQGATSAEFYYLDLESQLQRLYEEPLFRDSVKRQHASVDGKLRDVYDGRVYKQLTKAGGFLDPPGKNFTLSLNTDGVSVFSTSRKGELWPVYLIVNELPPNLRYTKRFMVLAAFWMNVPKPKMSTLLKPLMASLQKIYNEGIEVNVSPGRTEVVRGLLLLVTADLPAKAKLLVMKQYNGAFGCNECEDEGEVLVNPHRVWPYKESMQLRSHHSIKQNVVATQYSNGEAVMGFTGASVFFTCPYIDMSISFPVDYMHAVLHGVVPKMDDLWFLPKYSKEPFYIGKCIPYLNKQLLSIKVPNTIPHRPRSLNDRHYWKASEERTWLYQLSPAVLREVLPPLYYGHYYLLVTAIAILVSDEITEAEMDVAEKRLEAFCKSFKSLYGEHPQTMNVHKLRHLVLYVRQYGPLWVYSLFGFETMNSHIKKMIHGSSFIPSQITFTKTMSWAIGRLVLAMEEEPAEVKKLTRKLTSVNGRAKRTKLEDGVYCLGLNRKRPIDDDYLQALRSAVGQDVDNDSCTVFLRAEVRGQTFYSKDYDREKVRNSRTAEYTQDGHIHFGEVQMFCSVNESHFALLEDLVPVEGPMIDVASVDNPIVKEALCTPETRKQVLEVTHAGTYRAIPVTLLHRKCVFMTIESKELKGLFKSYVARFPNVVEPD